MTVRRNNFGLSNRRNSMNHSKSTANKAFLSAVVLAFTLVCGSFILTKALEPGKSSYYGINFGAEELRRARKFVLVVPSASCA